MAGNLTEKLGGAGFDRDEFTRLKSLGSATTIPGDPALLPPNTKTFAKEPDATRPDTPSPDAAQPKDDPRTKPSATERPAEGEPGTCAEGCAKPSPPAALEKESNQVPGSPGHDTPLDAVMNGIPMGYSPSTQSARTSRAPSSVSSRDKYDKYYHMYLGQDSCKNVLSWLL